MAPRFFPRMFIIYLHIHPKEFHGRRLENLVTKLCEEQMKKDKRCVQANIKGTVSPPSSKGRTDSKKVVSIQFLDKNGSRVGTAHLHEGFEKEKKKK